MQIFITGFLTSLSLILAIGAQNAFVLRQGLKGQYVLTVVMICAVSDAVLISLGVSGFDILLRTAPWMDQLARYGGAIFLLVYGGLSFYSAFFKSHSLIPAREVNTQGRMSVILICLGFTWLNPHVYLDTVILMGSISSQYRSSLPAFTSGAISASFVFFLLLGYGARLLRPFFIQIRAWKILDFIIGLVMVSIAIRLLY